jgi:hypothetical protein
MGHSMIDFNRRLSFERVLSFGTETFVRMLYVAFILAGIASGVVASLAEYEVVRGIFVKHAFMSGAVFGLLVVCVLETLKMFMIFFDRAYSASDNAEYKKIRTFFNVSRYVLVFISAACMFIYTAYTLTNPNLESQVAAVQTELRGIHDERVRQIDSSYAIRKLNSFSLDSVEVEIWQKAMQFEMNNVVGKTWQGPQFEGNRQRFQTARAKQVENQTRLEGERLAQIAQADSDFVRAVGRARDSLKTDPASQNQMIGAVLGAINGTPTYSYREYTWAVMIISGMLSFALESAIWALANILGVTFGDTFVAQLQFAPLAKKFAAVGQADNDIHAAETAAIKERIVREKRSIKDIVRRLVDQYRW